MLVRKITMQKELKTKQLKAKNEAKDYNIGEIML